MSGGTLYNILFGPVEDCCRDRPNSYHTSRDVKLNNTLLDEMLSDFGAWSVFTASAWCMELVSGEKALCFNLPHAQKHRLSEVLLARVMNAKNHGVIYQVALLAI